MIENIPNDKRINAKFKTIVLPSEMKVSLCKL